MLIIIWRNDCVPSTQLSPIVFCILIRLECRSSEDQTEVKYWFLQNLSFRQISLLPASVSDLCSGAAPVALDGFENLKASKREEKFIFHLQIEAFLKYMVSGNPVAFTGLKSIKVRRGSSGLQLAPSQAGGELLVQLLTEVKVARSECDINILHITCLVGGQTCLHCLDTGHQRQTAK